MLVWGATLGVQAKASPNIIAQAPLRVWPLYVGLLFLGFQRTRDGTLPLRRMLMLPIVVTLLATVSFVVAC